ncbi:MAG: TetR/AcrR family transcriptional regulator [Oceanospirillaceae bacterium]|nr:TetR/AcrR family transcriptional regulator [Oceanospirillaceae bacterium]
MARPAEFVRRDVLEKAMEVFWRTGFTGTSVTDLVKATNLKPGSLYGAFHSKRGLFMEVIDTYAQNSLSRVSTCLLNNDSPIEAIQAFFTRFSNDIAMDEIGRGCLMVNTMLELATEDDEIRERITNYLDQIEKMFADTLTRAQQQGELTAEASPEALAKFLMAGMWGMRVMSSKRPHAESYQSIVSNMLNALPIVRH